MGGLPDCVLFGPGGRVLGGQEANKVCEFSDRERLKAQEPNHKKARERKARKKLKVVFVWNRGELPAR